MIEPVPPERIDTPAAWRSDELRARAWVHTLSPADVSDVEAAAKALVERGANRNGAHDAVSISALKAKGLDELLGAIERHLGGSREEVSVTFSARRGDLVAMARRDGEVLSEEYRDGLVSVRARVSAPVAGRLRKAANAAT